MAGLVAETFLVDPRPAYPLRILATRYSSSSHAHTESNDGLTLIFLHATGMHKESWEVVIKRLFELRSQSTQQSKIRDIFSIESPNHGESAVINEDALKEHYQNNCEHLPLHCYAYNIHRCRPYQGQPESMHALRTSS